MKYSQADMVEAAVKADEAISTKEWQDKQDDRDKRIRAFKKQQARW